jgi:P-type Mg2+ transporter
MKARIKLICYDNVMDEHSPGLSGHEVAARLVQFGPNTLQEGPQRSNAFLAFMGRFKNPLVIILLLAALLAFFFGDRASFFIIVSIVGLSVTLDFVNTYRSERAAEALKQRVAITVTVRRDGQEQTIPAVQLVPGDVVVLAAGKVVPADGVVLESKDLFANEATLTGESFPQAKPERTEVFMGSGIMSGTGLMQITKTGGQTKFAHIARALQSADRPTEFEREIKGFSLLIIKLTAGLVVVVFLLNVLLHRNLLDSLLFSLALAVGLTPELLPLIITLNLTKGSLRMAQQGVIVKQLSAVQNFGSMDVLCTDKTGTLTEDKITLIKFVNGAGAASEEVFELGYIASVYSTGFENPLDAAVKNYKTIDLGHLEKIDEIPFDFERKREAVVVHHHHEKRRFLIVKGAPEAVFAISNHYGRAGEAFATKRQAAMETYKQLSQQGFRVLAVAQKDIATEKRYEPKDETDLIFKGFLAFLDPAKTSVKETLHRMQALAIAIKVITGDNSDVTAKIARDIGLTVTGSITGQELEKLSPSELQAAAEHNTIFARVNPEQKMQLIQALQHLGHVVGYLGDGVNDAPSLRAADVGVSVNNAVDVAKDAADFILLRKNLHELINGVAEGRRTFANTLKYLRMGLSSNFGNMFSMAGAAFFLPFLPMRATQILLNNLLYDASQFALPLDNVDAQSIRTPHILDLRAIKRFMWVYGPLSSVFDFATFGLLLVVFRAGAPLFQAGWFLESIFTQVLVVYIIRTPFPFWRSRPAKALLVSTGLVLACALLVILTPLGNYFGFGLMQPWQLVSLGVIVAAYLVSAELVKHWYFTNLSNPGRH